MGRVGYREVLVDLIRARGGGKFAEIGVERGKACKMILHHCGDIITEYWAVDPWAIVKSGKRQDWPQERWDKTYAGVLRLVDYYPQLRVFRMTSQEGAAVAQKEGVKFDVVFIDGDHSYEMVKADILLWGSLLREGGILTGHDYSNEYEGVIKAVNEVLGEVELFPGTLWVYREKNAGKDAEIR